MCFHLPAYVLGNFTDPEKSSPSLNSCARLKLARLRIWREVIAAAYGRARRAIEMGNFSGIKTAPKIKLSDFRKEGSEMMQGQDLVASKPDDRWGRSISFVFLGRESEIGRKRLTPNVNPQW